MNRPDLKLLCRSELIELTKAAAILLAAPHLFINGEKPTVETAACAAVELYTAVDRLTR